MIEPGHSGVPMEPLRLLSPSKTRTLSKLSHLTNADEWRLLAMFAMLVNQG